MSLPIEWEQVGPGLDPAQFNVRTVPGIVVGTPDPWGRMGQIRQPLAPAIAQLAA